MGLRVLGDALLACLLGADGRVPWRRRACAIRKDILVVRDADLPSLPTWV